MLRMILSVTGVGLILLGLVGGKPLDDLYTQFSAKPRIVLQDQTVVASGNASSSNTNELVAQLPQDNAPQNAESIVAPTVATASGTEQLAVPAQTAATDATESAEAGDDPTLEPIMSSQVAKQLNNQSVNSATKVAATVDTGDRNSEMALAQTILTASTVGKPLKQELNKEKEVAQAVSSSAGVDSEALVVVKDKVNMRAGPSIDHPIVLQLKQGQELIEFKREGKWVHVGAYGTSGKIGWVHQRLVDSQ